MDRCLDSIPKIKTITQRLKCSRKDTIIDISCDDTVVSSEFLKNEVDYVHTLFFSNSKK